MKSTTTWVIGGKFVSIYNKAMGLFLGLFLGVGCFNLI